MEWGKYIIQEVKSPDGYKMNDEKYTVDINRSNVEEPVIVLVSDEQSKDILVNLTKYQALTDGTYTETVLPNSTFKLFRLMNNEKISMGKFTTNSDGKITITNIPYGNYILTETGVPVGYKKCQDIEFTVSKDKEIYNLMAYDNRKSGVIEINNTTSNGEPAVGCKFVLYSETEEKISVKFTDEDGYLSFDNLEWGKYYILQENVPDYLVVNPQILSAEIHATQLKEHFNFTNNVKTGDVLITKTDEIGKNKLQGAKFNLYTKDGSLVKENLITNADGQVFISDLSWDTYYLKETQAPKGYDITESNVHFTISQDTVGSVQEIVVSDPLSTGNLSKTVTLTKKIKSSDINFDNGNPTFIFKLTTDRDIYGKAHTYHRMVTFDENYVQANTDENGYVSQNTTFSGLKSGIYIATEEESSRYFLKEVQAVDNATVKEKYAKFDLTENQSGSATFINQKYEWADYSDTQRVANILKKSKEYTALKTIWNGDDNVVLGSEINLDDLIVKAIYDDGSTKLLDKSDYTLDTQTVPTKDGKYPITTEYTENGITHKSIFYINIPKKVIKANKLEVKTTGALSDDNIVGQGDVISPLEFDVSVISDDNIKYKLSAGELVADETQSVTVNMNTVYEKTFENADAIKVIIYQYSNTSPKVYGKSNILYSNNNGGFVSSREYTVLGDYVKIQGQGAINVTLVPCYLENGDYTIDVHQAPDIEDETVKVTVTLNSEVFKSEKAMSKTVTLTTDVERTEVYAVGKDIQHYVLGVIYDNSDKVTMTVRGCGDVNNYTTYISNDIEYTNKQIVSWNDISFRSDYLKNIVGVDIKSSVQPVSMYRWFADFEKLKTPPVIPESVTDLCYTFYNCYALESLPKIPNSVADLSYTFYCLNKETSLSENINLDLSKNDLSKGSAISMFSGQTSVETINIVFGDIYSIDSICSNCKNLKTGNIVANDIVSAKYVFSYCPNIKDVSIECHNANEISSIVEYSGTVDQTQNTAIYSGKIENLIIKSTGKVDNISNIVREYRGLIKNTDITLNEVKYINYMLYSGGNYMYIPDRDNYSCVANIHIRKLINNYGSEVFYGNEFINELNIIIDEISENTSLINFYNFASRNAYLEKFSLSIPTIKSEKGISLSSLCSNCPLLKGKDVFINIDNTKQIDMSGGFSYCSSLEDIPKLPKNLGNAYALFENCTDLKNVNLNLSNATNINNIFQNCTSLETVTLNADKVQWASNSFKDCTSLKNADISVNSAESISNMFDNCVSLENVMLSADKVKNINSLFKDCNSLKSVSELPVNVEDMAYCFKNCISLSNIPDIPDKVENMSYAFSGCDSLTNVTLKNSSATNIEGMLSNCSGLINVDIDFSSAEIIKGIFSDCENLKSAKVKFDKVTDISEMFKNCKNLTSVLLNTNNATDMTKCFYNCTSLSEIPDIPNKIKNMEYAFYNCKELVTSPTIPETVTNLTATYMNCENLAEIPHINNSVVNMSRTFMGDISLTNAKIDSDTIKDISYIFMNCTGLTNADVKVNNADTVSHAFDGCTNLNTLTLQANNTTDVSYCLNNCTNLNIADIEINSVTDISNIFDSCININTVKLKANSVTDISNCFKNRSKLTSLTLIANNSTNLTDVVKNCTALEDVNIEVNSADSVANMFQFRNKLKSATLKANSSITANSLFYGCTNLISACVELKNATDVRYMFFSNKKLLSENLDINIEKATDMQYMFANCSQLTDVILNAKNIIDMSFAFYGCTNLKSISNIPNSVTDMSSTFYNCKNLQRICDIPNGVTNMASTFNGCTNLQNVPNIPNSVTDMSSTFYNCKNLTGNFTIPNTVTNISNTFYGCTNLSGNIVINTNPQSYSKFLYNVATTNDASVVLSGSSTMLDILLDTKGTKSNITIAE